MTVLEKISSVLSIIYSKTVNRQESPLFEFAAYVMAMKIIGQNCTSTVQVRMSQVGLRQKRAVK